MTWSLQFDSMTIQKEARASLTTASATVGCNRPNLTESEFVVAEVHPFNDGNERLARLAMPVELQPVNSSSTGEQVDHLPMMPTVMPDQMTLGPQFEARRGFTPQKQVHLDVKQAVRLIS